MLAVGQKLELRVEKLVATGKALARSGGQVVFLEGAYPGDRLEAEVLEVKRDYAVARPLRLLEAGLPRQQSACALFERCGGCDWLDLPDEAQLRLARDVAQDAFARLQRQEPFPVLGPLASPRRLAYRRRARLTVGPGGELGFHQRGSRKVVPILDCPVLVPALQRLLQPLAGLAAQAPGLREIHLLAGAHEAAVSLVGHEALPWATLQAAQRLLAPHGVGTVVLQDGTGRGTGSGAASIRVGPYDYTAPVHYFFQGNEAFDEELVRRVLEATDARPGDEVLELYAGVGLFTLPLAARARRVTAVELDPDACEALRRNLAGAGLQATVLDLDAAHLAPRLRSTRPDAILVDPPRSGLERGTRQALLGSGARNIAYLACDLTTLARDLGALLPVWRIRQVELLDLFPQTVHIEALARLERRPA